MYLQTKALWFFDDINDKGYFQCGVSTQYLNYDRHKETRNDTLMLDEYSPALIKIK